MGVLLVYDVDAFMRNGDAVIMEWEWVDEMIDGMVMKSYGMVMKS